MSNTKYARYLLPFVIFILLLFALFFWRNYEMKTREEYLRERLHQRSQILMNTISASLRFFLHRAHCRENWAHLYWESLVRVSDLNFVVLMRDDEKYLYAGKIPKKLVYKGIQGKLLGEKIYWVWKNIEVVESLSKTPTKERKPRWILILGVSTYIYRKRLGKFFHRMSWGLFALAIFLIAAFILWCLGIRNRTLKEALHIEQARSAYLEDLELAAAGLAHETKNPLGIIRGFAQRINDDLKIDDDNRIMAEHIMEAVDQATSRLGDFMAYAKIRKLEKKQFEACSVLENTTRILKSHFEYLGVNLEVSCKVKQISADRAMLERLLVNLLLNSLQASKSGSKVSVSLEQRGENARLKICDQGDGISPELIPKIFKPYFTGRPNGHGLGLTIVKRIADLHDWKISVDSSPEKGTIFIVDQISIP